MAKLLVQESAGVREFELVDNEVHVGRELDNALRLSDPSISRHHAVIRRTGEGFEIQDLQSSNGVLVNGTRLQTALLRDGDRVTLGQMQMTFVDPVPAEAFATTVMPSATPASPLGTVRMDPSEMAKIQGLGTGSTPPPAVPAPPPLPPPPAVPPEAQSTARTPPPMGGPRPFTIGPAASEANPAPAFLRPWLPPLPDDARPTGERGDFLTRLLACLIDAAVPVCLGVVLNIFFALGLALPGLRAVCATLGCLAAPLMGLLGIAYWIFLAWCWIKFGASPGKKIMKLRVVPEDDPMGRIDVNVAVLRVLGHWVNGILLGLPYLMILGQERKGLQDILSKSLVVKVDR